MIEESKIDGELVSKEPKIELECYISPENSQVIGTESEIDDCSNNEQVFNKLGDHNENIIHNFDQIKVFSRSNMEQVNSQYLYLTTTASSSDQVIDHCNPAFPIKELEECKKSKNESNPNLNDVKTYENAKNLIKFKIEKFNSVIKEDKEKRKVIVEWLNNNEWSCKQWSCKKFGKEGAAKRAIQFLEKIHGTTINCLPEGFYSTLLKIGSLEGSKSSYSRRKSADYSEKNANKRSKVNQYTGIQELDSSLTSSSPFKCHQNQNFHEPQMVNLIQKIMLLFSSLDTNSFELKEKFICGQTKIQESRELQWEKLNLNCRRQLRKLILENTINKKFSFKEYGLLLDQASQMLGINQTENDEYHSEDRTIFDSILGVKTVKEVLNKTVKSDLQLFYAIKDILQIIKMSEEGVVENKNSEISSSYWNNLIENGSRINDDLQYLLEGGLAGYSSVTCSNYGNGFFQFNCKHNSSFNERINFNKMINHKNSCMNLLHTNIQENGYRSVYPTYNERRIATRLQGKVQNLDNCEFTGVSSQKLLETNSILSDSIPVNEYQIEASEAEHQSVKMSNGIYTLLDMKYRVKGGQSREILCDMLGNNKVYHDENVNNNVNSENENQFSEKKIRKRRSNYYPENNRKVQRLNPEKQELKKSTIEWWKKPRGWKVTYYKEGQKYSQIFRVSLNSTNIERESQYKLAYNFYLSTREEGKEEVQTNNENDNVINNGNGINTIFCENMMNNVTEKLASSNFLYNIPNIINTSNLIQMLNTNINPRNIISSNAPLIGNILPLNYCLTSLFRSFNPPLYGIGINGGSNIQSDEGYNHLSMENHARAYPSTQISCQPYTPFISSINPFIIPVFPSLIQNLNLIQQNNNNVNTEWNEFPVGSTELPPNSNIINNKIE
ncbi:uncharacterized protein cubi_01542 [Cryptosporidium ubiquitum]|uniref:Uncharacterized protein n=1 Tax=Cryptosporidium ubiquitum TaxID=857276 RepID=A0A1J4MDA4_9CRYT|nr:uncharacterized protein cubi_01542 [Cryptosporidium ubiquitum]OII72209.1 hypothetical protein cubi_01542 [Cryptosporidium ubiquitum]